MCLINAPLRVAAQRAKGWYNYGIVSAMLTNSAHRSSLALLLLVPAPTFGVFLSMWFAPTAGTWVGQAAYALTKLWILAVPLYWLLVVEKGTLSWSPARRGGFGPAIALGLLISAVIVAAYLMFQDWIDPQTVREAAERSGIATPARYIGLAIYIFTINAVLEEYVWRWFVFRQCEKIVSAMGGLIAVLLSAMFFTIHHILALAAQFEWKVTLLGSIGVFVGGAVWSWCYLRYRSIWPGYVSHAIVDGVIFVIGWRLIFG